MSVMYFFVQVASSEWTLHGSSDSRLYTNAEMRNGQYCCCDDPSACSQTIIALNSKYNCTSECQTYFVVQLFDCTIVKYGCIPTDEFNFVHFSLSALSFAGIPNHFSALLGGFSSKDHKIYVQYKRWSMKIFFSSQ